MCGQATFADRSAGRAVPECECTIRTCFARDRDRIIHSNAFRRLKFKTQVFLLPEDDHFRTRLTHTLEVAQIARTIARAMRLNEDLAEAAALGHDLGHTPFGHTGEKALNEICPVGFKHNEQSLRVTDIIEKNGMGLNLTAEVRDGIVCHTGKKHAATPEGQIIHYSDRITYINHDIEDSIRAHIISENDIPREAAEFLGDTRSRRINTLILKMIEYFERTGKIGMDEQTAGIVEMLREFMFERVYLNPVAKSEENKGVGILHRLYKYYRDNFSKLPEQYKKIAQTDGADRAVCDYIAGMTDRYAIAVFSNIFVPRSWASV